MLLLLSSCSGDGETSKQSIGSSLPTTVAPEQGGTNLSESPTPTPLPPGSKEKNPTLIEATKDTGSGSTEYSRETESYQLEISFGTFLDGSEMNSEQGSYELRALRIKRKFKRE
jgi:hypothetical protein